MAVFIDTSVIIYAVGSEHEYKAPCGVILRAIEHGKLEGLLTVEVIQELLYRFSSIRRKREGITVVRTIAELLPPQAIDSADIHRAITVFEHAEVDARDALHAAWMLNRGIRTIVSADRHFDRIRGIRRADPKTIAAALSE